MPKKLTQEEFVAKAVAVFGQRYDYSQAVYVDANTKVTIGCPEHGPFTIVPRIHLQRRACRACGGNVPLTTESFIEKAQRTHGNKYDYSQVCYQSSAAKVRIGCPVHGYFEQRAQTHYTSGCRRCGNIAIGAGRNKRLDGFIKEAQSVHGGKYTYDQAVYVNGSTRITITCPEHGPFVLLPTTHLLLGTGCPACKPPRTHPGRIAKSAKNFALRAKRMHGDKYDYSLTDFRGCNQQVTIICPVHGAFQQHAMTHMLGRGCLKCGHDTRGAARRDEAGALFIGQARMLHGERYDYSKVNYTGRRGKIEIICPLHGPFMQAAGNHKRGSGCPECNAANARLHWIEQAKGRLATLYFLRIFDRGEEFYKVGISYNSIKIRYASKFHYQYEVLALHTSVNAGAVYDWEQSIIETFAHLQYVPKVQFGGSTECFSSANEILSIFPL